MTDRTQTPDARALAALAALAADALSRRAGPDAWSSLKGGVRDAVTRDPLDAALATALGGAWLFWLAERDANPKVTSFWDALVFVTTCMSVGYADIFARTDSGKAIAAFVMTIGPTLTSKLLDAPSAEAEAAARADAEVQRAILARLDAIHAALARPAEA
ncbi:MAG: ion channel [Polyangiales bacterium]